MAALRPELFGDFLLVQRLAKSSMAEALLGVRLGDRSGRTFVLKRPVVGERASGPAAQAIAREAEVLGGVRCDGLPMLEASGELGGLPYLAMEHIRGVSLDALLTNGPLPAPIAATIARDVAEALTALHDAGWVHGDVSPSNVVVDDCGCARLVDLGLAERIGATAPGLGGKPGHVAPEVVRGVPAAPALDVYAWGTVFAECVLGEPLFPEERALTDAASRSDVPPRREDLGEHAAVVGEALARDPASRPTARSLVARLTATGRDDLAERVAAALAAQDAPAEPRAPTPTAPMVVARPAPTLIDDPEPPPPAPLATRRAPPLSFGLVVAVVGALLIVGLAGLRLARPRHATLSLASPLPKRAIVEIDGKPTLAPDVGGSLTLPPGRHLVTVVLGRNDRRDYSIDLRAGDHVLVFPLLRGSAGAAYEGRDP